MGPPEARPLVLDAGALIAVERADREVLALIAVAVDAEQPVVVPAGVIGQVWRDGAQRARVARIIHAQGTTIERLDLPTAKAAGVLCGLARTSDVIDATVVIAARAVNALVITSDPNDLRLLDPAIDTHRA
ncbi:hypothetical protein BH24ACT5_BH24ACT5_03570 [soil metagenome]